MADAAAPVPAVPARRPRATTRARDALKPRELAFVVHYCASFKVRQAALDAGFPAPGAHVQASRLLRLDTIQAALREEMGERLRAVRVTEDRVLHELAILAFSDMGDYVTFGPDGSMIVDLSDLPPGATRAIQEITVEEYKEDRRKDSPVVLRTKLKLYNKLPANELLGKYLKMWVERHELTGPGGAAIPLEVIERRGEVEAEILRLLDRVQAGKPIAIDAEFEEVEA